MTRLLNPYLAAFLELTGGRLLEDWNNPWPFDLITACLRRRREWAPIYGWAIPDEHAIRKIHQFGPIVEACAGGGYWAWMLRQLGADVVAYDANPGENAQAQRLWTHVDRGDAAKTELHPDRTLLLCWPPYGRKAATVALDAHRRAGGTRLVYVGEHEGGCCADDSFFGRLARHYRQVDEATIPRYWGMHDYLSVWTLDGPLEGR